MRYASTIAAKPRKRTAVASPRAPAACTPSAPPRITIAIFTYHSGRVASASQPATPGRKLPIASPAASATMKPASPVSESDHPMPNPARLSGVAAT